jgi:hypothetical protein
MPLLCHETRPTTFRMKTQYQISSELILEVYDQKQADGHKKQALYLNFTSFERQIFHKDLNISPVVKTINRLIVQLFHGMYGVVC